MNVVRYLTQPHCAEAVEVQMATQWVSRRDSRGYAIDSRQIHDGKLWKCEHEEERT